MKTKTMKETNELINRGNTIDKIIKNSEKNKDVPMVGCPNGKIMLFYFWHNEKLESIWTAKHPTHSMATKVSSDGTLISKLIAYEPEINYVRHIIVDDKEIDSLIIWLYTINELSFAYKSVVSDPHFIAQKALGTYLEEVYSIKKSYAKQIVDKFPPSESWPCIYYKASTSLYPKWAIDESVRKYKDSSYADGKDISLTKKAFKSQCILEPYIVDGIIFSRQFKRKIGLICDSLYVPFTKNTVTIDLLKKHVTVNDLYQVKGMGFTSIQKFLNELENHGIILKKNGEFNLSKENVNPFGIEKERLLNMTISDANREYFSRVAGNTLMDYAFKKISGYWNDITIEKVVASLTIESLKKTKETREPGISKLVEEFKMAGIEIPEK